VTVVLGACSADQAETLGPPERTRATTETDEPDNEPTKVSEANEPGGLQAPPPVTVRYFDRSIDLEAWTYCYRNGCADGAPPAHPFEVGSPTEVYVEYPLPDWSFKASFTPSGEDCGRQQQVSLERTENGFVLRPAGHPDTYDVTLMGRGDGDLFTTFQWTTQTKGPLPKPRARLAVLADHDGAVDSYGVELELSNLAETPRHATAEITVIADNGDTIGFTAERASTRCLPEGTVYWDGPDDQGVAATRLGEGPFTYKVKLVLDGERYWARARWPRDEIRGNEPSARLDFKPGLPALT
jgi:hypothetical protein